MNETNMTSQQVFDFVVNHLRTQGKQSFIDGSVDDEWDIPICAYRSSDGLSCAVGCLIQPEEYKPEMEENPIEIVICMTDSDRLRNLLIQHKALLNDLQTVHDKDLVEKWEEGFINIAQSFNLVYTPKVST